MMSVVCRIVLAAVVVSPTFSGFCDAPPPRAYDVEMDDGVTLKTDVYRPVGDGPVPVILIRSPYPKEIMRGEADKYVSRGYAVVVQNVRGTGGSGGTFTGFLDDGWSGNTDGADTLTWISRQRWCNGKIGTVGGSAAGNTQVQLAPATDRVACQVIEVAACDFYLDLAYPGGVWRTEQTDRWFEMFGEAGRAARATLREHPTKDAFWRGYDAAAMSASITAPALHIGSWYDIFKEGTLRSFMSRQYEGGPGARGKQRLIMKWSAHAEFLADLPFTFPENVFDVKISEHRARFFEYWLNGADNGIDKEPPVLYYVVGDDKDPDAPGMEWRTATRWPPFPPRTTPLYLGPDGLHEEPPADPASRMYFFDPANPCPTVGGANLTIPSGPYDQRSLTERPDVLVFLGETLQAPLEVTGRVVVKLFVSTDAPDTDFSAKLVDVYPPGDDRQILVTDSIRRLKFRNGYQSAAPPLAEGEVVSLEIDLGHISWIFNTGHRLGLHISSSNYPRFEVNPNTGDDVPIEGRRRTAKNSVHWGGEYRSELLLPTRDPNRDTDGDGITDEVEWDRGTYAMTGPEDGQMGT